jgi:mono/diheme cytochrome c family protein
MTKRLLMLFGVAVAVIAAASAALATGPGQQFAGTVLAAGSSQRAALLDEYCVSCHNEDRLETGRVPVAFEDLDLENVGRDAEVWERVVEKMRLGVMPPVGQPRPDQETYDRFVTQLETELDLAAADHPNPGRPAIRRLTTAEYINAINSLISFEIDERSLLFPADDVGPEGFTTNSDVLSISPALFDRYLAAANRISRLAVGDPTIGPGYAAATYSTPRLLYQDDRMSEGLPFGSRGGMAVRHYFPLNGDYEVKIRLRRMIYDYIVGMGRPQEIEVRLDGALLSRFTVGDADRFGYPSAYSFFGTIRGDVEWEEYVSRGADAGLIVHFPAEAGMHVLGVSFVESRTEPTGVLERRASGFSLSGMGFYLDNAAVGRVEINGPHDATGPGDTPSRRAILSCTPSGPANEEPCARQILAELARRAYRRPATTEDVQTLMTFYEAGQSERGFESGIQKALERLLVAPEFLFRIERDPVDIAPGTAYSLNDLELASRLSFFLWSSIPDEELLGLAEEDRLHEPAVLERQVRRMLTDPQATALVDNFASQWLQLGRIRGVIPDTEVFFEFDENLRADMERETTLFLESQLREDRSVLDLLGANYTYVNERLARHYGLPDVYGERFRRVTFDTDDRGGLLGHASLLTLTAYPTRTSPVLRGKWLLDNILGMPPSEPPPDIPDLQENRGGVPAMSVRERMEEHRANPACAVCHRTMDPLGFALENFDAIGRWRVTDEAGVVVDAVGVLADGTGVNGPATLRAALIGHEESFVRTLTEKLMTYALGRGIQYYDQPSVRKIVADAARDDYRWSSIILEIVQSMPFQMRRAES